MSKPTKKSLFNFGKLKSKAEDGSETNEALAAQAQDLIAHNANLTEVLSSTVEALGVSDALVTEQAETLEKSEARIAELEKDAKSSAERAAELASQAGLEDTEVPEAEGDLTEQSAKEQFAALSKDDPAAANAFFTKHHALLTA